ncbi:hypothetical protein PC118_g12844 [Phytophthora cactorum]|uniref:Uncharacterized protein n=1 Tax=Phytophthora cactorum TaxID=29920 RepID=A0A8T1FUB2_9STRA|nr:hypothetical protein PC118_g12844 [Phytophthora cactorum]
MVACFTDEIDLKVVEMLYRLLCPDRTLKGARITMYLSFFQTNTRGQEPQAKEMYYLPVGGSISYGDNQLLPLALCLPV